MLAALLVLIAPTPLVLLPAIFPIATATIALRRVNYTLFVVAVTCLFVLVAELLLPATGIPVARAINSVIGSVVGAAAALLLWPDRGANGPAAQLAEAVAANLALAAQAIAAESAAPFDAARGAAGVASTAAEITCRRLALAGQSRRAASAPGGKPARHAPHPRRRGPGAGACRPDTGSGPGVRHRGACVMLGRRPAQSGSGAEPANAAAPAR